MTSNAMTITELSKLIATLTPQSKLTNAISYAFSTTSLSTKESTIVYTTFVMISGDKIKLVKKVGRNPRSYTQHL